MTTCFKSNRKAIYNTPSEENTENREKKGNIENIKEIENTENITNKTDTTNTENTQKTEQKEHKEITSGPSAPRRRPALVVKIRQATPADINVLAHQRIAMFRSIHGIDDATAATLEASTRAYLSCAITSGEYHGWLLEAGGEIVAGGGIIMHKLLPRPKQLRGGNEAYILNIYTEPAYRRNGFARRIMKAMMAWCHQQSIKRISLHASDQGRPLYESLGFVPTNEMRYDAAQ